MHHPIYASFLDNKYTATYLRLVSRAQSRTLTGYAENHHINPEAISNDNSPENMVRLTAREHFICHLLLLKMTTGEDKVKMAFAANMMGVMHRGQQRYKVIGRLYEVVKREFSKVRGELNTALWQDEKFRAKMAKKWTAERVEWYREMGRARLADPKVRAEYSARTDKLWADPEYRRKLTEANKKAASTPEAKAKRKLITQKLWEDPDYRAKVKASQIKAKMKKEAEFTSPFLIF